MCAGLAAFAPGTSAEPDSRDQSSVRATTPDYEAFRKADAIADPAERLAALRRFGKEFPESNYLTDSELGVFELLVEHWPRREVEIRAAVQQIVSRIPSQYPVDRQRHSANEFDSRLRTLRWIVDPLLEKKILLRDAELLVHSSWSELDRFYRATRADLLELSAAVYDATGEPAKAAELRREIAEARRRGRVARPGARLVPPPQPPAVAPSKPRFPEDEERYRQALLLKDPGLRLDALTALDEEFRQPTTDTALRAQSELLELLLDVRPLPAKRLESLIRRMLDRAFPQGERELGLERIVEDIERIVQPLVRRGVLLEVARTALDEGLQTIHGVAEHMNGDLLQFEGRIALARGDEKAAEAAFRRVLALNPSLDTGAGRGSDPTVHRELARIMRARGQERAALAHLVSAAAMRRPTRAEFDELAQAFAQLHGANESLEAILDQEYARLFPSPISVPPGQTGSNSGRVVLLEMFSGAECQPCQASDLAQEALMKQYPPTALAAVSYHIHIPGADPMATAATEARHQSYGLTGVPSSRVDGRHRLRPLATGGGPRAAAPAAYRSYNDAIATALRVPPQARITMQASRDSGRVIVSARVSDVAQRAKAPRLVFLLVQKSVRYQGANGVRMHPMVVRAVSGEGYEIDATASEFTHTFDIAHVERTLSESFEQELKQRNAATEHVTFALSQASESSRLSTADLAVVAFVQQADGSVLQAAQSDVLPPPARPAPPSR